MFTAGWRLTLCGTTSFRDGAVFIIELDAAAAGHGRARWDMEFDGDAFHYRFNDQDEAVFFALIYNVCMR